MLLVVDAAAGVLLTLTVVWTAYAVSCRLTRGAIVSVRATAVAIVVLWQLTAALLLLSAVRLFTRPVALALWCVVAALAHLLALPVVNPFDQLRDDLATARRWWSSLGGPTRLLIGIGIGLVLVRDAHGLVAPCITWDALTYHLYKPAVWVQSHGMASTAGPDAAGYYNWFPPYGDGIWAWWLLAMQGDLAIAPIATALWLLVPLACYTCARELDVPSPRATAAAAAIAFTPAVMNYSGAVYVDNLTVGLYVAGAAFLARAFAGRRTADAALAAAALAVLVGVKGVVVLPACAVGIAGAILLSPSPRAAMTVLAAAIPAAVPALVAWVATGSPLYPLTIRVGGQVLLQGHPQLEWLVHAGWMTPEFIEDARARLLGRIFLPWRRMNADFLNLGLGPLALIPGFLYGLPIVWRSKHGRVAALFLLLGGCLTVASILGDANQGLRLWWWGLLGRLVTIALAAVVIIAATWRSKFSADALWICAAAGLVTGWPRGVSWLDARAALAVLPAVAAIGVGAWILTRLLPRARIAWQVAAAVLILAALTANRDRFRYDFYKAAAAWTSYDVHPIDNRWTSSWPVWQRLDGERPLAVAVTAGWDGIGHNWYRYPLLGRRLQNQLLYVPITLDGSFVDYGRTTPPDSPLSCDAWLERVLTSPAEYFVMLPPEPPEGRWLKALPDIFVPELDVRPPGTVLFRIKRSPRRPSCGPRDAGVTFR